MYQHLVAFTLYLLLLKSAITVVHMLRDATCYYVLHSFVENTAPFFLRENHDLLLTMLFIEKGFLWSINF